MSVKPGDKMPDGSIYIGKSVITGDALYAMAKDAPMTCKWPVAMKYAQTSKECGHNDWRVPTEDEMKAISKRRDRGALKGTFNDSSLTSERLYWTSQEIFYPGDVHAVTIDVLRSDERWADKFKAVNLRLVRSGPLPS